MTITARPERPTLANSAPHEEPTPETILVVEDDVGVRAVISRTLGRLGYEVLAAEGGEEAIEIIRRHEGPIDLLLTDIMMPGMNGMEVGTEVARSRPGIPIFYMSGYADQELVRRGLLDPSTHFLQKPFSPQELGSRVREVLDRR
jgi:CheY-like chemotaxis protein